MSDEEVQTKCFDTHFETSGLGALKSRSGFLAGLKKEREGILNDSSKQVFAYMASYRAQEWRKLHRRKGKQTFSWNGALSTLVSPKSCKALAMLYLFGRDEKQIHRPKVARRPRSKGIVYKFPLIQGDQ